ncbi:MAG: DHH family phosphoesterase [Ignavibacteria bacterium]|nr:DHH family phosphoesterase [Ignavibacteria bacterium]
MKELQNKGCITSYVNPDTDGVCTAIAYEYYLFQHKRNFTPVFSGNLDNETKYVLDLYQLEIPNIVNDLSNFDELILVDTHNPLQLVAGFPIQKVIEIIDHHPDGDLTSFESAKIQNEKVGAACTLIGEKMKSENIIPTVKIAGIMSLAIISNTLNFTSPSTSERDRIIFNWLQDYNKISDNVIEKMFNAKSDISHFPTDKLIKDNLKCFKWGEINVGITQIETYDTSALISRKDFTEALKIVKNKQGLDYLFFSGIDILKQSTIIVCEDAESIGILNDAMNLNSKSLITEVNRILLRKTDFIPSLEKYFN